MKIGDIVSTPDGLGEIKQVPQKHYPPLLILAYTVFLKDPALRYPVKKYYRNELKLVYSPK